MNALLALGATGCAVAIVAGEDLRGLFLLLLVSPPGNMFVLLIGERTCRS